MCCSRHSPSVVSNDHAALYMRLFNRKPTGTVRSNVPFQLMFCLRWMEAMRPVDWDELAQICESVGCKFDRTKSDQYIMTKVGLVRAVVIPKKKGWRRTLSQASGGRLG